MTNAPNWESFMLPPTNLNNRIPVVFKSGRVTNSYKYYWFLVCLDFVEQGNDYQVEIKDLLLKMVVKAWHPVSFYHLNLGKMDVLGRLVEQVKELSGLKRNAKTTEVEQAVAALARHPEVEKAIKDLGRYVPYRLLSPWFPAELDQLADHKKNNAIVELSKDYSHDRLRNTPYRFAGAKNASIRFNIEWYWYLQDHARILRDFTHWHLLGYLQKRNPNTPNLSAKLYPAHRRNTAMASKMWKAFLQAKPDTRCIFSQQSLDICAIDHFLPWSYVAHDQLWNLIPISPILNSQKGNRLPSPKFLKPFSRLQYDFFQYWNQRQGKQRALEDYSNFFNQDQLSIHQMKPAIFASELKKLILPQFTIAKNMGFDHWNF